MFWRYSVLTDSGNSLRLVVSILYPAAGTLYPRDSFRKSLGGICFYRRLEVCGNVSGILDAHCLCPTDATLRGQPQWLLFWYCDQVMNIFSCISICPPDDLAPDLQ